jgi:hypothetical protein
MHIRALCRKLQRQFQQATVGAPGFASFISVPLPTPTTDKGAETDKGTDKRGSSYAAVPPQEPWSPSHLERAEVSLFFNHLNIL